VTAPGDDVPSASTSFEDLIGDRTGPDFVERGWLYEQIEDALTVDDCRYVLVTGEPGAGKTNLLAGLGKSRRDWLRYFVRQDSRTALVSGNVQSFLESIGHQLAATRPEIFRQDRLKIVVQQHVERVEAEGRVVGIRIDDVTVSPFLHTATEALLEVEQRITKVKGDVIGVDIGRVTTNPRLLDPSILAHLALIGPAEVLSQDDPDARIVILIDALDETVGERDSLLDWLARAPKLPRNVRLVLTSRPHAALEPLRKARHGQLTSVVIDPASPQVADDLAKYADRVLGIEAITRAAREAGHDPERVRRDAVGKAAGNFLYLATYARALADAVSARHDDELVSRLLASADLPPGLGGLYAFFVAIAHSELVGLGMLDIRVPVGDADRWVPAWEGVGQRVLGVLTVAREPLTVEELMAFGGIRVWPREVDNVLARLRWLLEWRNDGQVAFYHSSFGEFLADERTAREHRDYAVDTLEWHERIVRHYRGTAATWAGIDWSSVDRYGLVHIADHAVRCHAAIADEAVELVCGGLRRAIRARLGSDRHFLRLLDLVTERAIGHLGLADGLPTVLYLSVVRRQVQRGVSSLAPQVLGLLARLGRTEEALEHLAALRPSYHQFRAALAILEHSRPHRAELLELVVETALTMPEEELQRIGADDNPLKWAAQALAPHNLDRALRLWERGNEADGERSDKPDRHKTEAPDPIYRAAAAACDDLDRARELIASIHLDQAGAYLDLADRAEQAQVPELLRLAEACLPDARQADQMRGRARLVAALRSTDPHSADRHLDALFAAADRSKADPHARTTGIVEAAVELAKHDHATARTLLDRLDAAELSSAGRQHGEDRAELNRHADRAFLRAAELWVELGEVDRARAMLDQMVTTWHNPVPTRVRVSAVVNRFDPAEALRMIERAHAMIENRETRGTIRLIFRESDLHTVAVGLAEHDPRRAMAVAAELANVVWSSGNEYDRTSTMARIAHVRFDVGDVDTAQAILTEILRSTEAAPPLSDERTDPCQPVTRDVRADQSRSPHDMAAEMNFLFNHPGQCLSRIHERFYRDPADLVRAMAPGSWSIGNPYHLARTVRVFAEAIVDHDHRRATALVDSLADSGERAIGLAALFQAAVANGNTTLSRQLWAELTKAVADIPPHEWPAVSEDRQTFFAYTRPDYRARFEVAVRLTPYRAATALRLLDDTHYLLEHAFRMSTIAYASNDYSASAWRGTRVEPEYQQLHESVLTGSRLPTDREPLEAITRARVAFNEFLLAPSRRAAATRIAAMRIADPVYAAVVDLFTSPDGQSIGDGFVQRVRDLLPGNRLPAAAGLVAFAAVGSQDNERLQQLAAEVIAASEGRTAQRLVTLLQFATSPVLGELIDPVKLLSEAQQLPDQPFTEVEKDETVTRLFPILLKLQPPTVTLRLLHESVLENWSRAMALLEHAAEPIVATLGADISDRLINAIVRAMTCASLAETTPAEIDGVRVGLRS
jgi:hypothetical protein